MAKNIPNKKISLEEWEEYLKINTNLGGSEGVISIDEQKQIATKIFHHPILESKDDEEKYYKKMDNKFQKIVLLNKLQPENDIYPIETISYDGCFIGYKMTSPKLDKNQEFSIKHLKQLKEKLVSFHNLGIVHGDIKKSNILITKNGNIALCDLDNMQVESRPIDYFNYYVLYFFNDDRLLGKNADIYLYNMLFLQQLMYTDNSYDEIQDKILFGEVPNFDREEFKEEIEKMQYSFTNYAGKYLIDCIKDSENEVKVYGKSTKSNC